MRQSPFGRIVPTQKRIDQNDETRHLLAKEGDTGQDARHVRHFLYPLANSIKTRTQFASQLENFGFEIDFKALAGGIIAEEYREVASSDFDSLTASLAVIATIAGWEYDGWECAVARHDKLH